MQVLPCTGGTQGGTKLGAIQCMETISDCLGLRVIICIKQYVYIRADLILGPNCN